MTWLKTQGLRKYLKHNTYSLLLIVTGPSKGWENTWNIIHTPYYLLSQVQLPRCENHRLVIMVEKYDMSYSENEVLNGQVRWFGLLWLGQNMDCSTRKEVINAATYMMEYALILRETSKMSPTCWFHFKTPILWWLFLKYSMFPLSFQRIPW